MRTPTALFVLLTLLSPTAAFAQDLPAAGEAMGRTTSGTSAQAVTRYDFETDEVEGVVIRPLEDSIHVARHRKTPSLIRVRSNFVPEMVESVEDI